jgi:thiol-disulfide isomerase/thioredoxin
MIKNYLLLVLFLFNCLQLTAQKKNIVHYTPTEAQKSGIYKIETIKNLGAETHVQVQISFTPGWWTKFSKSCYLKDVASDSIFSIKNIVGAEFEKEIWTPESGDTSVTLIFDKLPKTVKKVDFGDWGSVYAYGVSIDKGKNQQYLRVRQTVNLENESWLRTKINESNAVPIKYFDKSTFFQKKNSKIVGFIKGYDERFNINNGIYYASNQLTNEDFPKALQIQSNGRFEIEFELNHPINGYFYIDNKPIDFYLEPGHALGIVLDWDGFLKADRNRVRGYKFESIEYFGALKITNEQLNGLKIDFPAYEHFRDEQKSLSPNDFKAKYLKSWGLAEINLDSTLTVSGYTNKVNMIAKAILDISYTTYLMDYITGRDYYRQQDTTNKILAMPIPSDYYDFLQKIDLNNFSYLISNDFSTFINRFEFSPLFPKRNSFPSGDMSAVDSTAKSNYGTIPLVYDIAKLRLLNTLLKFQRDTTLLHKTMDKVSSNITDSYLLSEANRLMEKRKVQIQGFELPDTELGKVFKNIIKPYHGKILIIDFWAENCGPCRANIEQTAKERVKFQDNPYFEFIFITDTENTSESFFESYCEQQYMKNSYRISGDDYRMLRELFNFNGIPHYVLVNADGRIGDDDFQLHNWKSELSLRYPLLFPMEYFSLE